MSETTFVALQSMKGGGSIAEAVGSKIAILHMGRHALSGHPKRSTLFSSSFSSSYHGTRSQKGAHTPKSPLKMWSDQITRLSRSAYAAASQISKSGSVADGGKGDGEDAEGLVAVDLYQAIAIKDLCRLRVLPSRPALGTEKQLTPTVLDSPAGSVAIATIHVVGAAILESDLSPEAASLSLSIFNKVSLLV